MKQYESIRRLFAHLSIAVCMVICIATSVHAVDSYTYTSIDYPGASGTKVTGISGVKIVGTYTDTNSLEHGFVYNRRTNKYNSLDGILNSPYGRYDTSGIWQNKLVGYAHHSGYLYDGINFQEIRYPNGETHPTAVNGSNVVGYYMDGNTYKKCGFIFDGQQYTTLDGVDFSGINKKSIYKSYTVNGNSTIVGICGSNLIGTYYVDDEAKGITNIPVSFIFKGGKYKAFSLPGTYSASANGIYGQNIVGTCTLAGQTEIQGFLYDGKQLTILQYPGATRTTPAAVWQNQVVGSYEASDGHTHGFLAVPSGQ